MPGRPPTMTRLDGWRPASCWSRSMKPVGTPVMASSCSKRASRWSRWGREQVAEGGDGVGDPALGHVEHQGLGLVDGAGDVVGQAVADLGDLAGDADEAAEQGVLLDDAGVAAGVADGRGAGLQGDEHGRPADRLQQVGPAQLVGHRDRVGRLALGVERGDGVEDVAVGRLVEVVGVELDLDRGHDGVAAEEHGAEQRLLGLEVVGWDPGARRWRASGRAAGDGVDDLGHGWVHHDPDGLGTTSPQSSGFPGGRPAGSGRQRRRLSTGRMPGVPNICSSIPPVSALGRVSAARDEVCRLDALWASGRHTRAGLDRADLLGDDLDRDPELDLGVEADRDLVDAEGLDGLVEVEAAAVEGDPGLGLDGAHHVGRGDRPEQPALGCRPWPGCG